MLPYLSHQHILQSRGLSFGLLVGGTRCKATIQTAFGQRTVQGSLPRSLLISAYHVGLCLSGCNDYPVNVSSKLDEEWTDTLTSDSSQIQQLCFLKVDRNKTHLISKKTFIYVQFIKPNGADKCGYEVSIFSFHRRNLFYF